jgi:hypothetical protein
MNKEDTLIKDIRIYQAVSKLSSDRGFHTRYQ